MAQGFKGALLWSFTATLTQQSKLQAAKDSRGWKGEGGPRVAHSTAAQGYNHSPLASLLEQSTIPFVYRCEFAGWLCVCTPPGCRPLPSAPEQQQ
jgi:hypothetical protein